MILFRRITRQERWQKRRARVLALAAAGLLAVLLALEMIVD